MADVRDRVIGTLEGAEVGSLISKSAPAGNAPIEGGLFVGWEAPEASWEATQADQDTLKGDDFAAVTADYYCEAPGEEPVAEEPQALGTVAWARQAGFDEEIIADLLERGLLRERWAPVTLDDVNWLVRRHAEYDAEAARLKRQYERRLRAINAGRRWLSLYTDDCRRIVAEHLPRKADGSFKRQFLDLEDGRVKLQKTGGGLVVNTGVVLNAMKAAWNSGEFNTPEMLALAEAVRSVRTTTLTGSVAVSALAGDEYAEEWKPEVLKTPLADYLKTHPEAQFPGVSVAPVTYEFRIEGAK